MTDGTVLLIQGRASPDANLLTALVRSGEPFLVASSVADALRHLQESAISMVIISLDYEVSECGWCDEVRRATAAPILAIGPMAQYAPTMHAQPRGVDVYLPDTMDMDIVQAHIATIRRLANVHKSLTAPNPGPASPLDYRDDRIAIDLERRELRVAGGLIHLTPKEFRLLAFLVSNADRPMTYDQILNAVWGDEIGDHSYIHTLVYRLRRKLQDDPRTPRYVVGDFGVGYRFQRQR